MSSYSGYLSSTSSMFDRRGGATASYYYQALQVTAYTNGTYTFSSNCSMDTYGYLYQGSFDLSYPTQNLLASDDDSGNNRQFLVTAYLFVGSPYALIITTANTQVVGSFSIKVSGPSSVGLTEFIPSTSIPPRAAGEYIRQCPSYSQTTRQIEHDFS